MTRKDYVLIAAAVKAAYCGKCGSADYTLGLEVGREKVAFALCDALANDNPRFDRERFLTAAGVA
jgi:hypothetical protein